MHALERSVSRHGSTWGAAEVVARAPGRVNLIGEHTDYNEGFALPMALPFDTVLALSSHGDPDSGAISVSADGFGTVTFDPDTDAEQVESWARYIVGVVRLLREHGVATGGWRATVDTDIPTGASLSSSAAVEVATVTALLHRAGASWSPLEVARLGQRVENEVVGVPSGIMDQFISAGAVEGHASLMDCRALTLTPTPVPEGASVVVMDTMTRRELTEGKYADRRASCERAARDLGVTALRDADVDQLARVSDPVDRRRAHHVIEENRRTVEAAAAFSAGDLERVGALMNESHASLRDDYDVSGPGLDAIVSVAQHIPGCLGARMTGGGFAGCAVALVDAGAADAFARQVAAAYDHDGLIARVWQCQPAAGASVVTGA